MQSTLSIGNAQRILIGASSAVARLTALDQDGEPADLSGSVAVAVTRASGASVQTGTATDATGTGVYTFTLSDAAVGTLDVLKITWSTSSIVRATTYVRVVGGYLFSLAELAQQPGASKLDRQVMLGLRDTVTDLFERFTRHSFVPAYDVEVRELRGRTSLGSVALSRSPIRSVRSITDDESNAISVTDLDVLEEAGIVRCIPTTGEVVWIGYEHGDSAPSAEAKRHALTTAVDMATRDWSVLSSRTRSQTNDLGVTQQFSYAGKDHPTGIDEVDAFLVHVRGPQGIG